MTGLALDEKLSGAQQRAREDVAERHFFDKAQPFFPCGFSICRRNPGHWDVFADQVPGKASAWRASELRPRVWYEVQGG